MRAEIPAKRRNAPFALLAGTHR